MSKNQNRNPKEALPKACIHHSQQTSKSMKLGHTGKPQSHSMDIPNSRCPNLPFARDGGVAAPTVKRERN